MEKDKFIRKILKNNMRLILIPSHQSQAVAVGIFIQAGTYQETENNNGVAHFLEHMLFQGTKNRSSEKIAQQLDQVGAQYNAATSYEFTYYYINGHKDNVKLFIDILFDIYQNPVFENKKIKSEKKVVLEELYMYDNVPRSKLQQLIHQKLFAHTPLHFNIAGTEESVKSLTKQDLMDFRSTYYTPQHTVCVVSGNFKIHKIQKLLEKKMNQIKINSHYVEPIIYRTSFCQTYPYVYVKRNNHISQVYLCVVFRSFPKYDPRAFLTQLVLNIFHEGFSSALINYLRAKHGLIYRINPLIIEYIDEGVCGFYLESSHQNLMKVIGVMLKEIKKLRENGISKNELAKAKKIMEVEMVTNVKTPLDKMINYGLVELFYQLKSRSSQQDQIKNLREVKLKEVNEVLNEIFIFNKLNIFIYGNDSYLDYDLLAKDVKNFE